MRSAALVLALCCVSSVSADTKNTTTKTTITTTTLVPSSCAWGSYAKGADKVCDFKVTLATEDFSDPKSGDITEYGWTGTGGPQVQNGIADTSHEATAKSLAYKKFIRPVRDGEILTLRFETAEPSSPKGMFGDADGWAGISLFMGETQEHLFIGSPGHRVNWGVTTHGTVSPGTVNLLDGTAAIVDEVAIVEVTYEYKTGKWTCKVCPKSGGACGEASGESTLGLAIDTVRIGADSDALADIAVNKIAVSVQNVATCEGYDKCAVGSQLKADASDICCAKIDGCDYAVAGPARTTCVSSPSCCEPIPTTTTTTITTTNTNPTTTVTVVPTTTTTVMAVVIDPCAPPLTPATAPPTTAAPFDPCAAVPGAKFAQRDAETTWSVRNNLTTMVPVLGFASFAAPDPNFLRYE